MDRSLQTAVMIMEAFEGQAERFSWDMVGHSGDGSEISLVEVRVFHGMLDFVGVNHLVSFFHLHFSTVHIEK